MREDVSVRTYKRSARMDLACAGVCQRRLQDVSTKGEKEPQRKSIKESKTAIKSSQLCIIPSAEVSDDGV